MDCEILLKYANVDNWTHYLKKSEDKHVRLTTALILENQKYFNEINGYNTEICGNLYAIIAEVIPSLLIHKWISFQPMISPNGLVKSLGRKFGQSFNKICFETEPVSSKTRNLKIPFSFNVKDISEKIKKIIELEVLTDLWNNCGTIQWDTQHIKCDASWIHGVTGVIYRKTLISKNYWVAINKKTYEKDKKFYDNMKSVSLYIVDGWEKDGILIGTESDDYRMKSYCYCPYIFLEPTEKNEMPTLFSRYGKRLSIEGKKSYAKIPFVEKL